MLSAGNILPLEEHAYGTLRNMGFILILSTLPILALKKWKKKANPTKQKKFFNENWDGLK
jgi:hypothetical protein